MFVIRVGDEKIRLKRKVSWKKLILLSGLIMGDENLCVDSKRC